MARVRVELAPVVVAEATVVVIRLQWLVSLPTVPEVTITQLILQTRPALRLRAPRTPCSCCPGKLPSNSTDSKRIIIKLRPDKNEIRAIHQQITRKFAISLIRHVFYRIV